MSPKNLEKWLKESIWPQIHTMSLNHAFFLLLMEACSRASTPFGPISRMIVDGYVTFQMTAIRRLCDKRKDVLSLMRALIEAKKAMPKHTKEIEGLENDLRRSCDKVVELTNAYIAHTARNIQKGEWNLTISGLEEALKAICRSASKLDNLLGGSSRVGLVPVPQYDILEEIRSWMPNLDDKALWTFWHEQTERIDRWRHA